MDVALKAGRFAKSSNGQLAVWGVLVWLVITGRIGFIFDSFLIIFAVLSVVPVVGLLLFRWWVSSNISEGVCPNCGSAVTGIKAQPFQCMSCGQVIKADRAGSFGLNDPTQATVDVQATDVIDVDGEKAAIVKCGRQEGRWESTRPIDRVHAPGYHAAAGAGPRGGRRSPT